MIFARRASSTQIPKPKEARSVFQLDSLSMAAFGAGGRTQVCMANLERSIRWSADGPYLVGSSSYVNLSQLGETKDVDLCAYLEYDRIEATAIKAIESLFCASERSHTSGSSSASRPHSAPATTFLPERLARFVGAASAIADEAEAPSFDGMPEYSSHMFDNGVEAC